MELERELAYFNAHRKDLISHYENQFALIKDESFIGAFTTEAEAYEQGLQKFGNQSFFIKRVTKKNEIEQAPALVLGLINASL